MPVEGKPVISLEEYKMQTTVQNSGNEQFQSLPIDFAFVTTFPCVRDAILQYIEDYEIVQDDIASLTYYRGHITIPATSECYEVAAFMLLERGIHDDQAVASITQMIKRWHPAYVVTIGIANSISEKVRLGDVVIADFIYDYEPTKQTREGGLRRTQQFPSDRLLYGQAFSYQSNEWQNNITLPWPSALQDSNLSQERHTGGDITLPWPSALQDSNLSQEHHTGGDITLPWPSASQTEVAFPQEHFGAIGNVTRDTRALSQLQNECPTLLAITRGSAAVARACSQQAYPLPFLEVHGICNYAYEHNMNNYCILAAQAATAFIFGLLRSRPIRPLVKHIYKIKEQRPLLVLCAQSLRPITKHEIVGALGQGAASRPIEIVWLDFTDLEADWVMTNPEIAIQRITDSQGPLQKALRRRSEVEFAFYGLTRIPLAFLIGHFLPSFQPVRMFDIHPHPDPALETWIWPSPGESFPPLEVRGVPRRKNVTKSVVAIDISISFTVAPRQIRAVGLHNALLVELKVPHPERGIVRSEEQVREYGRIFHSVLDLISERCPATKCIHVFYAGPMALAFHLAQQIAGDIHPPVVVWNFRQGQYDWGIDLAAARSGNPCLVRPLGPTFPSKKTDEYYRYFGD